MPIRSMHVGGGALGLVHVVCFLRLVALNDSVMVFDVVHVNLLEEGRAVQELRVGAQLRDFRRLEVAEEDGSRHGLLDHVQGRLG